MRTTLNFLISQQERVSAPSKVKPRSSKRLSQAITDLVATENSKVPVERQVTLRAASIVASRSLNKTKDLDNSTRYFVAYRDVASFITLSQQGKHKNNVHEHLDLLPVGHPLSEVRHSMTASALQHARARWIAADPRIDDSVRELVAAAYSHDLDSIERTHAFTRINALTAGLVPQELLVNSSLHPLIAMGGNDSASRSLRARLQRRDRKGRFAEEGGGMQFFLKDLSGKISSVIGRFAGNSASSESFIVEVRKDKTLKDGLYVIPANKAEALKAVLPNEAIKDLPKADVAVDTDAVNLSDLKTVEHPDGWEPKQVNPQFAEQVEGVYVSDDNFKVSKYKPVNGSILNNEKAMAHVKQIEKDNYANKDSSEIFAHNSEGKAVDKSKSLQDQLDPEAPLYVLFSTNNKEQSVAYAGVSQSWADTQEIAENFANERDKKNKKIKDDHEAFLKKLQEEQDAAKKKAAESWAQKAKDKIENNLKAIEDFKFNMANGKDVYGNDLPEGWSSWMFDNTSLDKYTREYMEEIKAGQSDQFFVEYSKEVPTITPAFLQDRVYYYTDKGPKRLVVGNGGSTLFTKPGELSLYLGVPDSENISNVYKETRKNFNSWDELIKGLPDWIKTNDDKTIKNALEAIKPFDKDGVVAEMINSGAPYEDIANAVHEFPGWVDKDEHKWAIDLPTQAQKQAWDEEGRRLQAVAKLRYLGGDKEEPKATLPETKKQEPVAEIPTPVEEPKSENISYTYPEGAYKLQTAVEYEPQGRFDEVSTDFTDDPKVLANKFNQDELTAALTEALIGTKDFAKLFQQELDQIDEGDDEEAPTKKGKPGPKPKKKETPNIASGSGALDFNAGEEYVPAEAIYDALKDQGVDVNRLVAEIYDSGLGEHVNVDKLNGGKGKKEESINAQAPSILFDGIDLDQPTEELHAQLAEPSPAIAVTMQIQDLKNNGETNKNITDLADKVKSLTAFGSYQRMLDEHIEWAFSDNPDEKQAFYSLWGTLLALDGGVSANGSEDTRLREAVSAALKNYNGTVTDEEILNFFENNGTFNEFVVEKAKIAKGEDSLDNPKSTAAGFFRLMTSMSKPNETDLFRGLSLKEGSDLLDTYTAVDGIITLDPRSFSTDKNTAGNWAGAFKKANGEDSIIFTIKAGNGESADVSKLSMFKEEQEHMVWGDFKIVDVTSKELPGTNGRKLYNVEIKQLSQRDSVLEGYDDNYESLLSTNNSVDLPDGYYIQDPDPYQATENTDKSVPAEFTDSPLYIARMWESNDLIDVYRAGIEDGSGTALLEYPIEDGYEASVPVEAIRDALQIQGIDTNKVLDDIANTSPDTEPTPEDQQEPAQSIVDSPFSQIIEDSSATYDLTPYDKKVGPQLGSNQGGTFEDAEGNQIYVKTPKSELHAQNEVLASALYRALGVDSAEVYLGEGEDGKLKTYSPIIPDAKSDLQSKLKDKEYLAKLQEGFAVDAWLANWDVAGLAFDNVMTDGDGNPVRVDPGGALLFRAMGSPKGSAFGDNVTELDTLRNSSMNPQSASIFGSMTDAQQKESASKLLDISNDEIDQLVHSIISDPEVADKVTQKLQARRQDILNRYDLSADDTSSIVDNNRVDETPATEAPAVETPAAPAVETPSDSVNNPYVTSDGVPIEIGMKVKHKKTGEVGTVIKYDKGNSSYVYVQAEGEKNPKVKSTKQLESVDNNGGGGSETPTTPEAPASPAPEEPSPAPVEQAPQETSQESTPLQAGSEVTDKKGNKGTIKKINSDNYALIQFEDGKQGWRSINTITPTGGVNPDFQQPKIKASKITGAGVEPVKVSEPADWTKSNFENVPSLTAALEAVKSNEPNAGIRGASAAVDSDSLEDLDVRVMRVQNADGSDGVRLRFKLTNWAGNERAKGFIKISQMSVEERQARGFDVTPLTIDKIEIDDKGVAKIVPDSNAWKTNTGRVYVVTTKDGVTIKFYRANTTASSSVSQGKFSGSATAFHNMVTIQAPADITPDKLSEAMAIAGVQDVRPSTPADANILIENRLMSIFDKQNDPKVNLKGADREASLQRIKDKYGITPQDVTLTTGASGRVETNLTDEAALKLWEAVGKPEVIHHSLTVPTQGVFYAEGTDTRTAEERYADWISGLLKTPQGGLLSTTTRWTEGIGKKGMSSEQDIGTGGADYVFTRPLFTADRKVYGVSSDRSAVLYFDPKKMYRRLDFYANVTDKFGARVRGNDVIWSSRPGNASELMFKHRIAWADLDSIVLTTSMRSMILQRLHDAGIDEIGGRPIEEVLIVGENEKKKQGGAN